MGKKNKAEKEEQKKKQSEERAIARRKASFQERLQIKDIVNRCYLTRKGEYLTVFSIGQKANEQAEDVVLVLGGKCQFKTGEIQFGRFAVDGDGKDRVGDAQIAIAFGGLGAADDRYEQHNGGHEQCEKFFHKCHSYHW